MKQRKNIALYIALLENEFSDAICEGAVIGAREADVNLFVMPGGIVNAKYNDQEANAYRYQYNVLYNGVGTKDLDAIIIEYGTVSSFLDDEQQKQFLKQFGDVPVILLAGGQEGYSSICIDNQAGLRETIRHLITVHQVKRIGFLSGPKNSQDAMERLTVYRSVMKEIGQEDVEDWIAYGNFSEYVEDEVEALLSKHPDIEAIVCANDRMAMAVYAVAERMGRKPGKDLLVTGFDDSPTALMLEPHLTSVKADTKELAYLAVIEAAKLSKKEEIHRMVKTRMVLRESCGCGNKEKEAFISSDSKNITDEFVEGLSEQVYATYFNNYFDNTETQKMRAIVDHYFDFYCHMVDEQGKLHIDHDQYEAEFLRFTETHHKGYINLNQLLDADAVAYNFVIHRIPDEKQRLRLLDEHSYVIQEFLAMATRKRAKENERGKLFATALTNVTRDMLQFSNAEKKKYETVLNKMQRLGFASCYLYTYGSGITHDEKEAWVRPKHVYVRGYYNKNEMHLYTGKERSLKEGSIFKNGILPDDRRLEVLVIPLFSGREQFGFMVTESVFKDYNYASQIACQLSVSIDVLEIIKKQNQIKKELEISLAQVKESNKVLDEMSHSDPLTGIYNRRGFVSAVQKIINAPENYAATAMAIYADMDNLKIVNDEFGHDDGDFALRTIAQALKDSFRKSDVIARMGGDEFAVFAITNGENCAGLIRDRIQSKLKELNKNDKPYYVNMSIGAYEFKIHPEVDINEILSLADEDLYKEKTTKIKVIYKNKSCQEKE